MSTRHRLGLQDLLLGSGTVTQIRDGQEVTIQRVGSVIRLSWTDAVAAIADANIDISVSTNLPVTGDTEGATYLLKDVALVGDDPETKTYTNGLATDGSWYKVGG